VHKGFPYHVVKEVYRELIETGEKYTRWFVVGLIPPTDKEPLRIVFGCLEEDKNAGPGGTKPRRFFNPVKIPVTDEGVEKMLRIASALVGCYMAMVAKGDEFTLKEVRCMGCGLVVYPAYDFAKELLEKMRHMAGR